MNNKRLYMAMFSDGWPACVLPILRLAAPVFATVEAGA